MEQVAKLSDILPDEEARKKFIELKEKAEREAEERTKQLAEQNKLSNVFATETESTISLPRVTFNGLRLMQKELGTTSIAELKLNDLDTMVRVLWILDNQSNPKAALFSKEEKETLVVEFGNRLKLEQLEEYLVEIYVAFGIPRDLIIKVLREPVAETVNPQKSTQRKAPKKKIG